MANSSSSSINNNNVPSSGIAYPLYLVFRDAGPTWDLIVPATLVYAVALCGIAMNSFVVFVTVRSTAALRGSANFLMALICLCEVLMQSGHTAFFVIAASGINFVRLLTANIFMIPMLFGTNMNMALLLSAALDRLFAVAMPHLHKSICIRHKAAYLAVHTLVCAVFGLYSLYYISIFSIQNPDIVTTGCVSELLSGEVGNRYFVHTTVLNSACVVCYLLIWAIVRCKKGVTKETNTRLLRSLVVIMLVSIGGYFINLSIYQLLFHLAMAGVYNPVHLWQLGFVAGILLNIGAAANAPILYLNSTEYRKAFKRHLAQMALYLHIKGNQTTTVTTSAVVPIRSAQPTASRNHSTTGAYY